MKVKLYHATTPETAERILSDGVLKADAFGEVFLCRKPLDACKFVVIRGVTLVSVLEITRWFLCYLHEL